MDLTDDPPFGVVGELTEEDGRVLCHGCGQWLVRIAGQHLRRHDIDEDTYREWAGLSSARPLAATVLRSRLRTVMAALVVSDPKRAAALAAGRPLGPSTARVANRHPKSPQERTSFRRVHAATEQAAMQRLADLGYATLDDALRAGWRVRALARALGVSAHWLTNRTGTAEARPSQPRGQEGRASVPSRASDALI